jgi:hypothetical protein
MNYNQNVITGYRNFNFFYQHCDCEKTFRNNNTFDPDSDPDSIKSMNLEH